jgi:hypothetical protein
MLIEFTQKIPLNCSLFNCKIDHIKTQSILIHLQNTEKQTFLENQLSRLIDLDKREHDLLERERGMKEKEEYLEKRQRELDQKENQLGIRERNLDFLQKKLGNFDLDLGFEFDKMSFF